jgi:exopolysaccharide biosynthesis polyprenyl glycosylphosphotransferase
MDGTSNILSEAIRKPRTPAQRLSVKYSPSDLFWPRLIEVLLDACTVFVCVDLGFRFALFRTLGTPLPVTHAQVLALVFSIVMLMLLDRAGAYRASGGLLRIRETASVLESVFIAAAVLIPCIFLADSSRWVLLVILEVPVLAFALILQKYAFHLLTGKMRRSGVSIYGAGASARALYAALERSPKLGLHPIALIADVRHESEINSNSDQRGGIPLIHVDFSASLLREHRADTVIISSPFASSNAIQRIMNESAEADAQVLYGAEAATIGHTEIDYIELDGQIVYGQHQVRSRRLHEIFSRGMDILVSYLMLLCVALPATLVAIAIRLDSTGPILFRQVRIGQNGVQFTILKFRTMHEEACSDSVSPTHSADPRITRVGRWLRRTSVDELPQLLNVMRGDMALVGPRPEMPFIVRGYSDAQRQRLRVKPGLTGIWQISAARRYPIHENIHYDLYYLKHRSLAMDVALLFHTLFVAISGI